jgi:site-specific DNA-adenine methylase
MEAIRNIEKQRKNIQDIILLNKSFLNLSKDRIKNYVIYCDIPYKNTTSYSTEKFPYDKFYKWCIEMSENNTVLISEYDMPKDKFKCIWSKEHITSLDKNDNKKPRIEKLFVVK